MRRRSASTALALFLGACASAGGVASTGSPAAEAPLRARLLRMTDTRAFDSALVEEALARGAPSTRAAAALAVGQVRARAGVPRLRALLADADTAVAASAAYALGLIRDTASIDALRSALDRPDPIAIEAAWALGEIGEPARESIVQALQMRLETAAPPPGMTITARSSASTVALLYAASKMRRVPISQVQPFLAVGRDTTAWAAVYGVTRPRVPEATRRLLALVDAPNPLVRMQVARGLGKGAAGDSLATEALAALHRLMRDAHPHVRINAARSLATYGPVTADALVQLARDQDANVRIAAAQGLATSAPPAGAPAWRQLWDADTTMMFRRSLLESAMRTAAELPAAETWAKHSDWRYRAAYFDAVAGLPAPAQRYRLAAIGLSDPDARVRARVVGAIGSVRDSVPDAADAVQRAIADTTPLVRAAALGALQSAANASGVPRALAIYRASRTHPDDELRRAALGYLAAAWRRDSAAFSAELKDSIAATEPPIEASDLAGIEDTGVFARWKRAARTGRSLEWYAERIRRYSLPSLSGKPPRAEIRTERGTIVLELFGNDAPLTVDNFATLARRGYYRGTRFHRVVPNFVVQDGDPTGTGSGGPGYAIRDEINRRRYDRGVLGMALAGRDTGGSQWFITHSPQPHLDGGYTVFGRVLSGWEVLDAIVQGDRITDIVIR